MLKQGVLAAVIAAALTATTPAADMPKPNVVVIMADDKEKFDALEVAPCNDLP